MKYLITRRDGGTAAGIAALLFLAVTLVSIFGFASETAELERVLKQMDAVGKTFRSFSARFSQKKYTAILKEFDTPETGTFLYARAGDGSALLRQEVVSPGRRIFTIKGSVATNYQPAIRQAQVVNLGKNKDKAEYLAIGLGQSPAKLRQTFDIKYLGSEYIDGAGCDILQLRPRSSAAAAYFSIISLWIKRSSGVPIQQKLQEPGGDYLLVKFSAEKLNIRISEANFEQSLPAGVEIQKLR